MAWTWIRPRDSDVLEGRPLLDVGCGDGQTMAALVRTDGLAVGADRSVDALRAARRAVRAPLAAAEATRLPFSDAAFAVVLAADLFHHLDDHLLETALAEIRRVIAPGGRLVAWWYEEPGRPAPDAPRFPRGYEDAAALATAGGFATADKLPVESTVGTGPPTVGMLAQAGS